jgi:EpsI family protein
MNPRLWTVILLLAGTGMLLQIRGSGDLIPHSQPLSQIPLNIAGSTGSELQISRETLNVLGAGHFLSREYAQAADTPPIDLFVGYFPTQRTGVSIHSPKNCLPGSGWAFESSRYLDLADANGKPHRVGEYVITDGENRQFVIYWYQAHGRSVANEYLAKMYFVFDAIRMNRTDGGLVRIATPINSKEGTAPARAQAESFASQLVTVLPRFIPD